MSTSDDFIENPKTIMVVKKKGLLKYITMTEIGLHIDKTFLHDRVHEQHLGTFERADSESTFE